VQYLVLVHVITFSPLIGIRPRFVCSKFSLADCFNSIILISSTASQRLKLCLQFSARLNFTTKPLSTKNVDLGMSSKVHCKASGSTKIYWTKEPGETLPDDVEDVNGTLIFNNVKLDHKGNYTCIASNDEESIKTTVEVRILPKFDVTPPKELEVVELQSVFLDCSASGSPTPTVKWDHEATIISTNEGNDARFKIFDNGTLLLHEARQDDSGVYGCFIGNSAGFKRAETHLMVKCKCN
jgi:PTK7 protein tyrosine kinase 7